jgi:pyruvate kinase
MHDPRAVRGRRRRVPAEHEPRQPRRDRRPPRHHPRRSRPRSGRPIGILADLQGPKLRVGTFAAGAADAGGGRRASASTSTPRRGRRARVSLPHPEIFAALVPGATLLVNDGKIRLRVDDCGPDFADCTVEVGGDISNRKGVNVPDVVLPLAALSDKDRADLEFVCELGVDWLALSFVQRAGRT